MSKFLLVSIPLLFAAALLEAANPGCNLLDDLEFVKRCLPLIALDGS